MKLESVFVKKLQDAISEVDRAAFSRRAPRRSPVNILPAY